jgi:hypothetical protein
MEMAKMFHVKHFRRLFSGKHFTRFGEKYFTRFG